METTCFKEHFKYSWVKLPANDWGHQDAAGDLCNDLYLGGIPNSIIDHHYLSFNYRL